MPSNNKGRHAYLIITHERFDQLALLLSVLDDPRNDIFLHIDKKIDYNDVIHKKLQGSVHYSTLTNVNRVNVTWGGYSQVLSELNLFSEAGKGHYDYYHLLSGIDFPLKTQDEIHNFFDQNYGKEFVHFSEDIYQDEAKERLKYYRLWTDFTGRSKKLPNKFIKSISCVITKIQKICKVNRIHNGVFQDVKLGSNWVSITDALCQHIISCKKEIYHTFRHTICGDEELVQTLVWNSNFRRNLYLNSQGNYTNVRAIDWNRGAPYVWKDGDYTELVDSDCLFARKIIKEEAPELFEKLIKKSQSNKITREDMLANLCFP